MLTLADVQVWSPNINPVQAQALIDGLIIKVDDYVGHPVLITVYEEELHTGDGTCLLPLCAWPIISIQKVMVGKCELDLTNVKIRGKLKEFIFYEKYSTYSYRWPVSYTSYNPINNMAYGDGCQNISVSYTAGFADYPADLKLAMAREVVAISCRHPGDPGPLVEERTPGGMTRRWRAHKENSLTLGVNFSPELLAALNSPKFSRPLV